LSRNQMACCLALALCLAVASAALAGDIVTLPTANQLKADQIELAYYRLDLNFRSPGAPSSAGLATAYWGITNRLELDAWWVHWNHGAGSDVAINPSFLVLPETVATPAVVVGAQDITGALPTGKVSYYVAAAKNVFHDPKRRFFPLIRLHGGVGTKMNNGFFGGVQAVVTGRLGLIILNSRNPLLDGNHWITGLSYTFPRIPLVVKGGTLGRHAWIGAAYTLTIPTPVP